jgi:hypothetical protein
MTNEMTTDPKSGPRVPTERPDPEAAARDPGAGAEDRAGFDLGGAVEDANGVGSNTIPGGPKGSTSHGTDAGRPGDGPHQSQRLALPGQRGRRRLGCRLRPDGRLRRRILI